MAADRVAAGTGRPRPKGGYLSPASVDIRRRYEVFSTSVYVQAVVPASPGPASPGPSRAGVGRGPPLESWRNGALRWLFGLASVAVAVGVASVAGAPTAIAHPHVFVEAKTEIVFGPDGRAEAIRQSWRFDKFFSSYAILGYDTDNNGLLTTEELSDLAKLNAESLSEFDFFTFIYKDKEKVEIKNVSGYWLGYDPDMQQLTFYFVLNFAEPVTIDEAPLTIDVFDPEYFVAMEMTPEEPFALIDAPPECAVTREAPAKLDPQTATMLALIPREGSIPEETKPLVAQLSNTAIVSCGAAAAAAAAAGAGAADRAAPTD